VFTTGIALPQLVALGTAHGLARVLGGASLGTGLVSLAMGTIAVLAVAMIGRWWLVRRGTLAAPPADVSAKAGVVRTVLLGLGYLAAGGARLAVLLAAMVALSSGRIRMPGRELEMLVTSGLGPAGVALLACAVVVLAPLGEETLFRGVLLSWLARWMPRRAALWLSAVVFALAHLHYGVFMVVVLLYGMVLGWARLVTGGLKAPMALHAIINAAVLVAALARRSP
jgi:membrane protease YdiL (CAAX protease family)